MIEATDNLTEGPEAAKDVMNDLLRDGAQRMLMAAIEAEVSGYIEKHMDERDEAGHRLVVRNGKKPARRIATGVGMIEVQQPRVNDRRVVTTTPDAGCPQNVTVVVPAPACWKFAPTGVTGSPPAAGPWFDGTPCASSTPNRNGASVRKAPGMFAIRPRTRSSSTASGSRPSSPVPSTTGAGSSGSSIPHPRSRSCVPAR